MAVIVALIFLLFASPAAYAVDHIVGDGAGWGFQANYTTWAAGIKFTTGDNLVFNYDSSHGVVGVNQSDYTSCNTENALKNYTTNSGTSTIPLTQVGQLFFACPTPNHCGLGMKLAITVTAASSGGSNNGTTTTPSGGSPAAPPPTTTPSTPTTTTPNNAAAGSFGSNSLFMIGVSTITVALFSFNG